MKTKKALAGLLGLLGSFTGFSFFVFFPAFVAAAPFFTESLPQIKRHKHAYEYQRDRGSETPWSRSLCLIWLNQTT